MNLDEKAAKLEILRPDVILADFDRTLTYLYKETQLLQELAERMIVHYEKFIVVPEQLEVGERDGYHVWHALHTLTEEWLLPDQASRINHTADASVAEFERKIIERIGLFDDVVEAIRGLYEHGIRLGIVSSNATSAVHFAMEQAGIIALFECIHGRPYPFDPKRIKPSPYPIVEALKAMNVHAQRVWYVGDDVVDMQAAKSAKVVAVGVCTGRHTKSELVNAGADFVFDSFCEMSRWIKHTDAFR